MQVQYEAKFAKPFFRLQQAHPELLEAIHQALQVYNIQPPDIHLSHSARSFGDYRIYIRLFNGNGSIDITPSAVETRFNNAVRADVEIIQNCIIQTTAAIERVTKSNPFISEHITFYPSLILEDQQQRDQFLVSLNSHSPQFKTTLSPSARTWPGFKLELENQSERWIVDVSISRAWTEPTALFVAVHANFYNGAGSQFVSARSDLIGKIFVEVLKYLGLDLPVESQSPPSVT